MRQHKDEGVGALDGLGQVRLGNDIVAEGDPGQVFHVLVLLVNDLGQLASLKLFPLSEFPPMSVYAKGAAVERALRRTSSSKHHM